MIIKCGVRHRGIESGGVFVQVGEASHQYHRIKIGPKYGQLVIIIQPVIVIILGVLRKGGNRVVRIDDKLSFASVDENLRSSCQTNNPGWTCPNRYLSSRIVNTCTRGLPPYRWSSPHHKCSSGKRDRIYPRGNYLPAARNYSVPSPQSYCPPSPARYARSSYFHESPVPIACHSHIIYWVNPGGVLPTKRKSLSSITATPPT